MPRQLIQPQAQWLDRHDGTSLGGYPHFLPLGFHMYNIYIWIYVDINIIYIIYIYIISIYKYVYIYQLVQGFFQKGEESRASLSFKLHFGISLHFGAFVFAFGMSKCSICT